MRPTSAPAARGARGGLGRGNLSCPRCRQPLGLVAGRCTHDCQTSDRPLLQTVSAEIPEWSRRFATTVVVGPRETRALRVNPELLPQAYENTEIRRAILEVSASSPGDPGGYTRTCPVYLHSISDLYWGARFANAQFVARWVTPHDPAVIQQIWKRSAVPAGW